MTLLISQSYAYASVPCESNAHATGQHSSDMGSMLMHQSMGEHDMTSHMQQDSQQHPQQQKLAMDCCDQDCSCLSGACASATVAHFIITTPLKVVSEPSGFELFLLQDAFLPSLHKPPIIS